MSYITDAIARARQKRQGLPEQLPGLQSIPGQSPVIPATPAAGPKRPTVISQGPTKKSNFISDFLRDGLFGDTKEKEIQRRDIESGTKVPLLSQIRTGGFAEFLGRTNAEKITIRKDNLVKKGMDPTRAGEASFYSVFASNRSLKNSRQQKAAEERLKNLNLSGQERRLLFVENAKQKTGEIGEAADLFVGGTASKGVRKVATKAAEEARILKEIQQEVLSESPGKILNIHFGRSSDTIGQQLENAKGTPRVKQIEDIVSEAGFKSMDEAQETLDAYRLGRARQADTVVSETPPKKPKAPSKPKTSPKPKDLDFTLPEPTRRSLTQTALQDKFKRLNQTQEAVTDAGGKITPKSNSLNKARLFVGKAADKIDQVRIKYASKAKDSLASRLVKEKKSIDDFGDYLHAKHAKERNVHVASINKKLPDGGSGMTNAQADNILNKFQGKGFEKFADEAKELADETLNVLEESGILSKESRADIQKTFQDYVPLKVDKGTPAGTGGRGFSVSASGIKRVKGSTKERANPFVQLLVDHENAIARAEKNKVGQSFLQFAQDNPNEAIWKVRKQGFRPHYNEAGEFIMAHPTLRATDDVLEVWKDGKLHHIEIKDKELAKAMKNLGQERVIPLLANVNNYLRAVNTTLNPEFLVSNFQRDIQTALINIAGENDKLIDAGRTLKNVPKAMKGVANNILSDGKSTDEWAQLYKEFKAEGAKVGWIDVREVGDRSKELTRTMARIEGKTVADKMGAKLESLANFINSANETVESATRLAAYKAMKDAGKTAEEAALIARDLTVDFNKKGNLGTMLNSAYLFANAGIQGGFKIATTLYKSKLARRITGGIVAANYGLAELNRNTNEKEWKNIPDYIKDTNTIIMQSNGKMILVRAPYGYNVFNAMGVVASDLMNKDITPAEAMKRIVLAFDAGFNPLSSGDIVQLGTPTLFDPIVQVSTNKNFAGSPIRPEAYPGANKPDSQLYFSTVREPSKASAEFINKLTGGSATQSGKVDVSPETIDHWIDFVGGGVGKFFANTINTGVSFSQGELPVSNNTPIIRKFIYENNENSEKYSIFQLSERSETKVLSPTELNRFRENLKQAMTPNDDGETLMDADAAVGLVKKVTRNQAKHKTQSLAEDIQSGKVSKQEGQQIVSGFNAEEVAQFVKAIERLQDKESE